jgi:hypothetical protein
VQSWKGPKSGIYPLHTKWCPWVLTLLLWKKSVESGLRNLSLKATSHTRPSGRDHDISSTLIGGKRRSGSKFASHHALRDQRSVWMQDGCEVYVDSYVASNVIMFHGHLDCFQKPLLGDRPDTKLGDHGTTEHSPLLVSLFYFIMWGLAWVEIHWSSIWLRA